MEHYADKENEKNKKPEIFALRKRIYKRISNCNNIYKKEKERKMKPFEKLALRNRIKSLGMSVKTRQNILRFRDAKGLLRLRIIKRRKK